MTLANKQTKYQVDHEIPHLLYNIVPVKSNLFKWKLSDDDLCPECNIKEDILHAFLLCERVKAFWKWLGNIICKN